MFTNGVFDLLHRGHVTYLEQARATRRVARRRRQFRRVGPAARQGRRPSAQHARRPDGGARGARLASTSSCRSTTDTPRDADRRVRCPTILVKGGDYTAATTAGAAEVIAARRALRRDSVRVTSARRPRWSSASAADECPARGTPTPRIACYNHRSAADPCPLQTIDREVDARGLNCPLPILRTKKALNDMTSGQTDPHHARPIPASVRDFQAFARQTGNELVEHGERRRRVLVRAEASLTSGSRAASLRAPWVRLQPRADRAHRSGSPPRCCRARLPADRARRALSAQPRIRRARSGRGLERLVYFVLFPRCCSVAGDCAAVGSPTRRVSSSCGARLHGARRDGAVGAREAAVPARHDRRSPRASSARSASTRTSRLRPRRGSAAQRRAATIEPADRACRCRVVNVAGGRRCSRARHGAARALAIARNPLGDRARCGIGVERRCDCRCRGVPSHSARAARRRGAPARPRRRRRGLRFVHELLPLPAIGLVERREARARCRQSRWRSRRALGLAAARDARWRVTLAAVPTAPSALHPRACA